MAYPTRNISTYELPNHSGLGFLLCEDGSFLLCEDSTLILLEENSAASQTLPTRNTSSYTLPTRN